MIDILKPLIKQFMPFAQEKIGFERPPKLFLRTDAQNAANPLGKTAFYDPSAQSVTLYVTGRHPKDILRSLAHELVHHKQNCDGQFANVGEMGEGYAQTNPHLRQMEIEANRDGSMCLRDWEDGIKGTIYFEHLQKGDNNTMSTKTWKNKELTTLLSEAWGFGFNLNRLNEDCAPCGDGDVVEEAEEEVVEEEKEEITEMCPDVSHGTEMVAIDAEDAEEGGMPEEPSAIVDELGDLLTRLQVALGGKEEELEEGDEPESVEEDPTEKVEEQIRKLVRRTIHNIYENQK